MNIKYKNTLLWKIAGITWLIVALMNLGLLIFLFNGLPNFGFMIIPMLIFIIICSSILSFFYLQIHRWNYIEINEQFLSIHQGLVLPKKIVKLSDIEEGRLVRSKFILILKNEKEVPIYTRNVSLKDLDRLKMKLCVKTL